MRLLIILMIMMMSIPALSKTIRVAIIDTGFAGVYSSPAATSKLCKSGHYDFSTESPNVGYDTKGHGSYVANIIAAETENTKYCLQIYKVFGVKSDGRKVVARALKKALQNGAKVINLSLEIKAYSNYDKKMFSYVTKKGIKIFAAAGNKNQNLNEYCNVYPSCYKLNDNLIRVGATDVYAKKAHYSNYGMSIAIYKFGEYSNSAVGTSFAAPRAVADYLNELGNK